MKKLPIKTEYIKLDSLLKFASLVSSGGEGKMLIKEGLVTVNGVVCTERGKKIRPGDRVGLGDEQVEVTGGGE